MKELRLKIPIKIKPTIHNDGYIITDANNTCYFFYGKDGRYKNVTKITFNTNVLFAKKK